MAGPHLRWPGPATALGVPGNVRYINKLNINTNR